MNVYGDIQGSDIHHMYYGMYSYGHQGGVWTDNLMHDNVKYGEEFTHHASLVGPHVREDNDVPCPRTLRRPRLSVLDL